MTSAKMIPATPSPSTSIRTPHAPRLGFHDDWEPYSPRKSSRLSAQRTAARTPSPLPSVRQPIASPHTTKKTTIAATTAAAAAVSTSAAIASPAPAPRKKRQTTLDSIRRITSDAKSSATTFAPAPAPAPASAPAPSIDSLLASASTSSSGSSTTAPAPASASTSASAPATSTATATAPEDTAQEANASASEMKPPTQKSQVAQVARSAAMLPTPSKTPQKPPCDKDAANLKALARNLFPSEESATASPRRKRSGKLSGLGLDSFAGDEAEEPIHIFTDSQDRIPKKDDSESNPFFNVGQHEAPRRSKRRQIMIPGEGFQSIEEASRREDGMIYVFRGKKFFRKFAEAKDEEPQGSENESEAQMGRALTRSSIKPRLLFPVKKTEKTKEMLEEEETATDIEEGNSPSEEDEPQTPTKTESKRAETPEAPNFAPASPPDTKRITRSTNKAVDAPAPIKLAKKKSPFDSWRRTKESSATPSNTKRQGEPLASTAMKRARA